ncbi:hypothetical protein ACOMHN_064960 [Nucella lapillus]
MVASMVSGGGPAGDTGPCGGWEVMTDRGSVGKGSYVRRGKIGTRDLSRFLDGYQLYICITQGTRGILVEVWNDALRLAKMDWPWIYGTKVSLGEMGCGKFVAGSMLMGVCVVCYGANTGGWSGSEEAIGSRVGDRGLEIAGWRSQVGDRGLETASWGPDREVQDPGQVQDPSRSRGESELEEEIELSGMMDRADQFERLEERRRSLSREIERHERSMSSQGVRFREKEGESGSSSDDTEKKGLPVRVKTEGSVVDPGDSFALSSGEDVSQWALVGKEMGLTGEALGRFVTVSIRNAELKEERREELRLKKRRENEELRLKEEELRIKAIRDDEELRLKKIRDGEDKFRLDEALRLKAIRDDEELRLKKRRDDEELRLKARREEEDKFRLDEELKLKKIRDDEELRLKEEELRLKERRDDEGLRLRREEVDSNRDYQGKRLENDETKNVKIEPLGENDDVDAFVAHFEQVAGLCRWSKASWSSRIIALLKGKAREAVLRLTSTQLTDYDEVKTALLVHFRLDAEAYRKKFRGMRKEGSETFEQALTCMKRWFSLWCKAAKKDETDVDDVKDLLLQEQMYRMFNSEFTVEVRRTCPRTVDEVAREATVFAEAKWIVQYKG